MVRLIPTAALAAAILSVAAACGSGDLFVSRAERTARHDADQLRERILRYADFVGFEEGACGTGDVRVFTRDTLGVIPGLLRTLEVAVVTHGAGASLDTRDGRALIRALARLEVGGPAPRWDTLEGDGPRVFNPVLSSRMLDPVSQECIDVPGDDPNGMVLPELTGFEPPRDSGAPQYTVAYGPQGLFELRDFFHARWGQDDDAVLRYVRLRTYALWWNYAVLVADREEELRGVVPMPERRTGAAYVMHRTGGEWRVLAIIRTW